MIKIKEVGGQNFLSIGQETVTLELSDQGIIALGGVNYDTEKPQSNGSGKSVLSADLLMFGLFGMCARGRTAGRRNGLSADDVINGRSGKGMMTRVVFEARGHEWTVERYRKFPKLGTMALLRCDGRGVTSKEDVQARINGLLGLDYEAALNMLVLDQDHVRSFASMTDKEQKAIFESILDLSVWTEAQAHADAQLKRLLAKLDRCERESEGLIQRREIIQADARDLMAKDADYLAERAEKVEHILASGVHVSNRLVDIAHELEARQVDPEQEEKTLAEYNELVQENDRLNTKGEDIAGRGGDTSAQIGDLNRSMRSKTEQIKRFQKLEIGDACPTCGGVIEQANVSGLVEPLQRELEELTARLERQTARQADLQAEHVQNEKAKKLVHVRLPKLDAALGRFKAVRDQASRLDDERLRQEKELADIKKRAVAAENEPSPYQALIEEKQGQIDKVRNLIRSGEAQGRKLTAKTMDLEFWVKGFGNSGIKSRLLAGVTAQLNQKANEYARALFGDSIKIEFQTQTELKRTHEMRERFQVNVKNSAGAPLYLAHSSGERRGVDLCVALALNHAMRNRAAEPVDLLVLDEPFENLDSVSTHRMGDLLKTLREEIGTVLITSHRFQNEAGGTAKVWTVEKRDGVSRLITKDEG